MIHINNFIDKIKFFESKHSKDFIIPLTEAKNLHSDITKLLLVVHEQRRNITQSTPTDNNIKGGGW
jgi:hypothetical protein